MCSAYACEAASAVEAVAAAEAAAAAAAEAAEAAAAVDAAAPFGPLFVFFSGGGPTGRLTGACSQAP